VILGRGGTAASWSGLSHLRCTPERGRQRKLPIPHGYSASVSSSASGDVGSDSITCPGRPCATVQEVINLKTLKTHVEVF
jgi:hypothetical protein